jgi:hypothetical protein
VSVLRSFLATTRTLRSLPGHTFGRRSGGAGEHTVPPGRVAAHFRSPGICLRFADAERRPELERVRGDLAQLEVVVGTGENLDSFLKETGGYEGEPPGRGLLLRGGDLATISTQLEEGG